MYIFCNAKNKDKTVKLPILLVQHLFHHPWLGLMLLKNVENGFQSIRSRTLTFSASVYPTWLHV